MEREKKILYPPSLTQGAFIKAGLMQGWGWPLLGDPCTAGGLFWKEQQDRMWYVAAENKKWNSCKLWQRVWNVSDWHIHTAAEAGEKLSGQTCSSAATTGSSCSSTRVWRAQQIKGMRDEDDRWGCDWLNPHRHKLWPVEKWHAKNVTWKHGRGETRLHCKHGQTCVESSPLIGYYLNV